MPIITLPDGSKKVFEKSVTILEIAQSIGAGLASATIAGKVNDVLLDATIPINEDSEVVIITSKDKEGIEIIRHSFAHLNFSSSGFSIIWWTTFNYITRWFKKGFRKICNNPRNCSEYWYRIGQSNNCWESK